MIDMNHCEIGDCREIMRRWVEEGVKVQMCVCSPPYWGLRDYGTGTWVGGSPECDHKQGRIGAGRADGIVDERGQRNRDGVAALTRDICACGARRIDKQLGLERTPDCGRPFMRMRAELSDKQRQAVLLRLTELGLI